jgi:hypothetical protein
VVIFTPLSLYSRETDLGTLWLLGWAGSRSGLDAVAKRKKKTLVNAGYQTPAF